PPQARLWLNQIHGHMAATLRSRTSCGSALTFVDNSGSGNNCFNKSLKLVMSRSGFACAEMFTVLGEWKHVSVS
ncbi:MAG: hypothetical protein ACLPX9_17680, partial [Rhodomicrobium sp.]